MERSGSSLVELVSLRQGVFKTAGKVNVCFGHRAGGSWCDELIVANQSVMKSTSRCSSHGQEARVRVESRWSPGSRKQALWGPPSSRDGVLGVKVACPACLVGTVGKPTGEAASGSSRLAFPQQREVGSHLCPGLAWPGPRRYLPGYQNKVWMLGCNARRVRSTPYTT